MAKDRLDFGDYNADVDYTIVRDERGRFLAIDKQTGSVVRAVFPSAMIATPGYAEPGSDVGMSPNYVAPRPLPKDEPPAPEPEPEWPPKRELDLGDSDGS